MIRSIRVKLALWYAGTLAAGITALGWFTYSYVARETTAQTDQELANVTSAFAQLWRASVAGRTTRRPEEIISEARAENFEFVVFDETQREIASNTRSVRLRRSQRAAPVATPHPDSLLLRPDLAPLFRQAGAAGEAFTTLTGPLGQERAYAVLINLPGRREIVAVIRGMEAEMVMLQSLRSSLLWAIPIGLVGAFAGGIFLAGRALSPIGEMASQAERIGARTLHERLRVANPGDELGQLSAAVNHVLGRLETAFEQQRRFMAEASHELRTPIAVVRGEADLALGRDRSAAEYREALSVIGAESRRMTRVVEDLFLLARADAGQLHLALTDIELADLATASCRTVQTLATARRATVVPIIESAARLKGDEGLIGRTIVNLLDNALKYGRVRGTVEVAVGRRDGSATLAVRDDGPGIPAELQARIFDRFYRGPSARTDDDAGTGGGAGLGLAIAKGIAEAHGGTLRLVRSDPTGTEFLLELPSAD